MSLLGVDSTGCAQDIDIALLLDMETVLAGFVPRGFLA